MNITGGAVLESPKSAKLKVLANDFPVILFPSVRNIEEGSSFNFQVVVKKVFNEDIVVSVTSIPKSATINDFDAPTRNITIKAGQLSANYTVHIPQDDIPEMTEEFDLMLTATSGDTVLYSNFSAVVFIPPNDDPGGVVQFAKGQPILYFKENEMTLIR